MFELKDFCVMDGVSFAQVHYNFGLLENITKTNYVNFLDTTHVQYMRGLSVTHLVNRKQIFEMGATWFHDRIEYSMNNKVLFTYFSNARLVFKEITEGNVSLPEANRVAHCLINQNHYSHSFFFRRYSFPLKLSKKKLKGRDVFSIHKRGIVPYEIEYEVADIVRPVFTTISADEFFECKNAEALLYDLSLALLIKTNYLLKNTTNIESVDNYTLNLSVSTKNISIEISLMANGETFTKEITEKDLINFAKEYLAKYKIKVECRPETYISIRLHSYLETIDALSELYYLAQ